MTGVWLWLLPLFSLDPSLVLAIDVRTQGQCPAAVDVQQRLAPILPQSPAGSPLATDVAAVEERADGTLRLSLSRSNGDLVGRRELPRAASCADQADTVAVTLAVWEAALHADLKLALDRLPSEPAPKPPQPPAELRTPSATVQVRGESARPPQEPGRFLLGAALGLGGALTSSPAVALDARLDAAWSLAGDNWRLRLSAGGGGEHALDVPPGEAYWQRLFLSTALERVLARFGSGASWKVLLGAGPVVGYVLVRGAGFNVDHRDALADLGAEAAARLERRVGRWRGFLLVTTAWWLRSQRLDVVGRDPTLPGVSLPRSQATVAVGASFSVP